MALIFKMDLVWWIDIFIQYVLPALAFVIAIWFLILVILVIGTFRRGKRYERRRKN